MMRNPFNYPDDKKQCPWCGSIIPEDCEDIWKRRIYNCGTVLQATSDNWVQSPTCRIAVLEDRQKILTEAVKSLCTLAGVKDE